MKRAVGSDILAGVNVHAPSLRRRLRMLGAPKKNRNKKGLALTAEPPALVRSTSGPIQVSGSTRSLRQLSSGPPSGSSSCSSRSTSKTSPSLLLDDTGHSRSQYHNTLSEQLATLELGVEFKLELNDTDLTVLGELGNGNGGTVFRARHHMTGIIMAKKVRSRLLVAIR